MKLSALSAQPKLIKISLDEPQLVEKYGEAVEFWTWDRQPISTFMQLAAAGEDSNRVLEVVVDYILDESGDPIITGDNALPGDLLLAAVGKVVALLGK